MRRKHSPEIQGGSGRKPGSKYVSFLFSENPDLAGDVHSMSTTSAQRCWLLSLRDVRLQVHSQYLREVSGFILELESFHE